MIGKWASAELRPWFKWYGVASSNGKRPGGYGKDVCWNSEAAETRNNEFNEGAVTGAALPAHSTCVNIV